MINIKNIKAVEQFMGNLPRFEDPETMQGDEGYLTLGGHYSSWNGVMPVYHKLRLYFLERELKIPESVEVAVVQIVSARGLFDALSNEIERINEK